MSFAPQPAATDREPMSRASRALVATVTALLLAHLAGGVLAISTGVNTPGEAWGSEALLAAPLPMVLAQLLLTLAAVRWPDRRGLVAAALLAAACGVSVTSAFFDGALASEELGPGLVGYQLFLLALTGVVGTCAALRVRAGH